MKRVILFFAILSIIGIYYTVKISSGGATKDKASIKTVATNATYKVELEKYNKLQEGHRWSISAKTLIQDHFKRAPPNHEEQLPEDFKNYLHQGISERAIIQYAGLFGERLDLTALRGNIGHDNWNTDYLLKKMYEVLTLPSIASDPIVKNSVLISMGSIPEIKEEALLLLKESVKDISLLYTELKASDSAMEGVEMLHRDLLTSYALLGESNPEEAIIRDGQSEAVAIASPTPTIAPDEGQPERAVASLTSNTEEVTESEPTPVPVETSEPIEN